MDEASLAREGESTCVEKVGNKETGMGVSWLGCIRVKLLCRISTMAPWCVRKGRPRMTSLDPVFITHSVMGNVWLAMTISVSISPRIWVGDPSTVVTLL